MIVDIVSRHLIILLNGLYYASVLFMVAIGLSWIFGSLNFLNIAHAAFFTLAGFISVSLFGLVPFTDSAVANVAVAIGVLLIVTAIVVGFSLLLESTLFRSMYKIDETFQLVATFALLLMLEDMMKFVWGTSPHSARELSGTFGQLSIMGRTYPGAAVFIISITALSIGTLYYFINYTKLGKISTAMSEDREMVEASGVNVRAIHLLIFAIGVALAAIGGAMWVGTASLTIGSTLDWVLLAFAVIVIGGLGSFRGAVAAALLLGIIRSYGITYFPEIELAIVFLLMAFVMLVKPQGLFGGASS